MSDKSPENLPVRLWRRFLQAVMVFGWALAMIPAVPANAEDGDAGHGEKVFRKCKACHRIGEDAKNVVGPVLNGVIGRTAGTYPDFKYSDSLVAAGEQGLVWDEEMIFAYLQDPRQFLRDYLDDGSARSKMTFNLRDEEDRHDVIAYLKTFSPDSEGSD